MTEAVIMGAGVIYAIGVLYGAFVALQVLASADCDHAFIIILGYAIPTVLLWPLALPYLAISGWIQERREKRAALNEGTGQ